MERLLTATVPTIGPIPQRQNEGDAGADLVALDPVILPVGQSRWVDLGTRIALPEGTVGLLFARSGLGTKGIGLANHVGVIDSGYRGPIRAKFRNESGDTFEIKAGDRVAQLVIVPVVMAEFVEVDGFVGETERGEGGFGSTGIAA